MSTKHFCVNSSPIICCSIAKMEAYYHGMFLHVVCCKFVTAVQRSCAQKFVRSLSRPALRPGTMPIPVRLNQDGRRCQCRACCSSAICSDVKYTGPPHKAFVVIRGKVSQNIEGITTAKFSARSASTPERQMGEGV